MLGECNTVFTDKISGKSRAKRQALAELLEYIRDDDTVRVASMDRLGRDTRDLYNIVAEITDKGAAVEFVNENITVDKNGASPMGSLMLGILAAFAEFERRRIKERQAEGIALAKTKGKYAQQPALSDDDVEQVKALVELRHPKTDIARQFQVSRHQISSLSDITPGSGTSRTSHRPPFSAVYSRTKDTDMDDLHIPPGPGAPGGLVVPAADLVEQFSRSSGPGGQGVNTADSRVQLSIDLGATSALTDSQRRRVLDRLAPRLSGTVLTISASEHRSQLRNRAAARERLSDLIRDAVAPPIPRRRTRPSRAAKRRRLESKRRRSEIKQNRRRPPLP